MEYIWIFYALGGMLAAGLMDFNKKMVLVRWYNADTYLLTTSILFCVIFCTYAFFYGENNLSWELIFQWSIYGLTNFLTPLWMITAYKYTSISFSLVSIRLLASFFLLLVGMFYMWDDISIYNIIGFIFWMWAIFLLSWWKKWGMNNIHIKWYLAIILAICSIVFGHSFLKYVVGDIDIPNFMAIQTLAGLFFLWVYLLLRRKIYNIHFREMLSVSKYSLVPVILFPIFLLYLLPNLYLQGPLSLGYKILSYSIIVPIILSIIFLGEEINRTRIIAFGLTIASIFLFLI